MAKPTSPSIPRVVWSVYFARSNSHGPLPPLRMICSSEADARAQFKLEGVSIGREEILEEKGDHPNG